MLPHPTNIQLPAAIGVLPSTVNNPLSGRGQASWAALHRPSARLNCASLLRNPSE